MQHLVSCLLRAGQLSSSFTNFQARVRFLAYHRIKPHVPPLVRAPVNSFEFFRLSTNTISLTDSIHRLLRGLPGYLILFDTHAFVPQRQS